MNSTYRQPDDEQLRKEILDWLGFPSLGMAFEQSEVGFEQRPDLIVSSSDDLGRTLPLFRIDSTVWQSGQIIGDYEPKQEAAREALLIDYSALNVGVGA